MGDHRIRTVEQLREVGGESNAAPQLKVGDVLDEHAIDFLAASPFVVPATGSRDGELASAIDELIEEDYRTNL